MRRIITAIPLVLGLTGGIAAADPYHRGVERRDNRHERFERAERVEHFRDARFRPAARYERFETRAGFRWVTGDWSWNGYEWIWMSGHYVRC